MDKKLFKNYIKHYETNETIKSVGKIDTDFLCDDRIETLYYGIPLIEKIIIEIYKLVPEADIEYYEQGTMRTPIAIIDKNIKLKILPQLIINDIKKIFDDNGIRNKIFHVSYNTTTITVNFGEIRLLIVKLLHILIQKITEYNKYDFYEIEHI